MNYKFSMLNMVMMIVALMITLIAQSYVSWNYRKSKKISIKSKMTGREVARQILDKNNLENVYIVETGGMMTDHYDPTRKTIRLSSEVYNGTSIAAASIAAHEVGHAIQDKENYSFLRFRNKIIPIVNFSSFAGYIAILIGFVANILSLVWLGIILEFVILFFQLITLPVEFDASRRAKIELSKEKILVDNELVVSNKMLRAAAYTYVASVATTLLEIARLLIIVTGRDD